MLLVGSPRHWGGDSFLDQTLLPFWLMSRSITSSRSIHVAANDRFHSFRLFFGTALAVYGGSQARGRMEAKQAASLRQSHSNVGIQAASATYTTAHSNTGSLTHWVRLGIEPESSWLPVGFMTTDPWWELPDVILFMAKSYSFFFPSFLGYTWSLWKFLGQGSNPSHIFEQCHSCGNAGSLTHSPGPGIEPTMPQRQAGSVTHFTTAGTPGWVIF